MGPDWTSDAQWPCHKRALLLLVEFKGASLPKKGKKGTTGPRRYVLTRVRAFEALHGSELWWGIDAH